jgi:uncharacterized membrane protein
MATHPGIGVHAASINGRGQVLEQTVITRRGPSVVDSFVYTAGNAVDLGGVRPDIGLVWATGLNDSGEVAGQCVLLTAMEQTNFTYTHGKLTALPASSVSATGLLVNNSGTIAATIGGPQAALLIHGNWQPLGTLTGQSTSTASAINNDGVIAGASGGHAAIWTKGKWTDLGGFAGQYASYAVGINRYGQVAGLSMGPSTVPFVWDSSHGLKPLAGPTGLTLGANAVAGINNFGAIAGTGYDSTGNVHVIGWYGGQTYDVTGNIVNTTGLRITQVTGINDRFQISADAMDAFGVTHPVVLSPSY